MATPKGIVTLSDGREIPVDVSTLKIREWRLFWNASASDEDVDKVVSRLTGLKVEAVGDLLRDDYRLVMDKIIQLSNRPLDDPNSRSAST